jgi:hypothetical protein
MNKNSHMEKAINKVEASIWHSDNVKSNQFFADLVINEQENPIILELEDKSTGKSEKGSQNVDYPNDVHEIINKFIIGKEDKVRYLEIGVDEGYTFNKVKVPNGNKHGVDPYGGCENITHKMPSQEFFAYNKYFWKNTYDIIFIDGLHLADIIIQEVRESLKILNPGGYILLHDIAPLYESRQEVWWGDYKGFLESKINFKEENKSFHEYSKDTPWIGMNGDSWKAMAALRTHTDLTIASFPTACCGVVSKSIANFGSKKPPIPDDGMYTWKYYQENMNAILNPIGIAQIEKLSETLCWKGE